MPSPGAHGFWGQRCFRDSDFCAASIPPGPNVQWAVGQEGGRKSSSVCVALTRLTRGGIDVIHCSSLEEHGQVHGTAAGGGWLGGRRRGCDPIPYEFSATRPSSHVRGPHLPAPPPRWEEQLQTTAESHSKGSCHLPDPGPRFSVCHVIPWSVPECVPIGQSCTFCQQYIRRTRKWAPSPLLTMFPPAEGKGLSFPSLRLRDM